MVVVGVAVVVEVVVAVAVVVGVAVAGVVVVVVAVVVVVGVGVVVAVVVGVAVAGVVSVVVGGGMTAHNPWTTITEDPETWPPKRYAPILMRDRQERQEYESDALGIHLLLECGHAWIYHGDRWRLADGD